MMFYKDANEFMLIKEKLSEGRVLGMRQGCVMSLCLFDVSIDWDRS